ncbi:MAG: hypothetical protein M1281_18795 [Chloroflexi bacterium]|nr:hypothetical protein [Chloroflexota bacterium]
MPAKPTQHTSFKSPALGVRLLALFLVLAVFLSSCQVADNKLPVLVDVPVSDLLAKARDAEPKLIPVTNATSKNIGSLTGDPNLIPLYYWPQAGTPAYLANFAHPEAGCKWFGIAGQVFDQQGNPIKNLAVIAGTVEDGVATEKAAVSSGNSTAYGPQGYEIVLGNTPEDTSETWYIQLSTLTGTMVSDPIYLQTYSDCQKNLIIMNFQEITRGYKYWFPVVEVSR